MELTYIDRIKLLKSEKKITNDRLSELTGIPLGTLSKILAGISDSPKLSNIVAICGALEVKNRNAIGILETFTAASAVVAADTAAKTALVDLIEVRLAKGMCGKSYVILTGSVSSVTAAIERAKAGVEDGMFLDSSVIAGPDDRLWESIL